MHDRKFFKRVDVQSTIITMVITVVSTLICFFIVYTITYNDIKHTLDDRAESICEFVKEQLEPEDFEIFTTYENYHFCKPNLNYYKEVVEKLGVKPEECLMVGNDVGEDMVTEELGMKVFLMSLKVRITA